MQARHPIRAGSGNGGGPLPAHFADHPSGGDHFYMADVGETQMVLNLWGTLHGTGYPLYAIIGNVVADASKALPL